MASIAAIVLVCLSGVEASACTRETAVEVRAVEVANELGCTSGWQEIFARAPQAGHVGKSTYLKTLCERVRPQAIPGAEDAARPAR